MSVAPLADDRDERLLHRLEAFSDIVIGFSLAQSALSLSVPDDVAHFQRMLEHPWGFIAYVLTFCLVASIWWSHNRLFARYFVPNMLSIVLNFALLGFLVLFVFSIQILIKLKMAGGPYEFYVLMFAAVYMLLAALYFIGVRGRRAYLTEAEVRNGLRKAVRTGGIALGIFAGTVALVVSGADSQMVKYYLAIPVAVVILTIRIADRLVPALRKPKAAV